MNHQKTYNSIINNALIENRIKLDKNDAKYIYFEEHHIIPRCLNGSNQKENKVLLTSREHFVCHKLLTYIYKGNRKIACAFNLMSNRLNKENLSSRDYAYARELLTLIPVSQETKEKMSKALKGKNIGNVPWNKNKVGVQKHSESTKQKISKNNTKNAPWRNKKLSEEHKKRISIGTTGKNIGRISPIKGKAPWNKGKSLSEETKIKMRASAKNRKRK